MPPTQNESDEALDGLPEFAPPTGPNPYEESGRAPSPSDGPSTPTSPHPPTSSTPPPNPFREPTDQPPPRSTSSSTASSDDVDKAFDQLGSGLATMGGALLNKATQRKGKAPHDRWLMTEEEANGIGGALGRLAARRVPEELKEGDNAEVLELVTVGGAYIARNAVGLTPTEMATAAHAATSSPRPPAPAPAHPPAAPQGANPFAPTEAPATVVTTEPSPGDLEQAATQASPLVELL